MSVEFIGFPQPNARRAPHWPRRSARGGKGMLAAGAIACALSLCPGHAHAEFRLCNRTESRVGVSVGYKDGDSWVTEGWWNVAANSCETLLRGDLPARYYYLYAVDYDQGGEWSGKAHMCTREKEYTIRGAKDCLARGFERTGFFEVDTQQNKSWTVQLTQSNQRRPEHATAPLPLPSPVKK